MQTAQDRMSDSRRGAAIDGMPAVGKTTLAVHAAHTLAEDSPPCWPAACKPPASVHAG
ncbi:hypothetical protein [Streptomyces sp. NPDC052107]|uniref:hypothetical protein n=1 Tax=Streptomyces sp. NPDC052107 TaxID=3155632 RepID=UPI00343C4D67